MGKKKTRKPSSSLRRFRRSDARRRDNPNSFDSLKPLNKTRKGLPFSNRGFVKFKKSETMSPLAPSPFWSSFNRPITNKSKICSDRSARRSALFKSGFAGKGKVRKAVWTAKSKVRC